MIFATATFKRKKVAQYFTLLTLLVTPAVTAVTAVAVVVVSAAVASCRWLFLSLFKPPT